MTRGSTEPIRIAILAMGGEGGGVLADWLVEMAEHEGWIAQATSVPGVAQRTGATIYYVELFPGKAARQAGMAPILALMPLPGDVDIVVASEAMEAARAVQRGLVTPDRTTLVASTHRVYAIAEKVAMGDGRSDAVALLHDARRAAKRFIAFDMAQLAQAEGSVISAVLFGALAGTGELPFTREQFEATIRRGGVGVQASLRAFAAAAARAATPATVVEAQAAELPTDAELANEPALPRATDPTVQALIDRVRVYRGQTRHLVLEGLRRLIDYQDAAYAGQYLDRLAAVPVCAAGDTTLSRDLARHLALWMSWEDTIRVADLKTRATRFDRVRAEVRAAPDQLLGIHEYLHPRLQEVAESMPVAWGRRVLAGGALGRVVGRLAGRGRVVATSSLPGFVMLWTVAGLRRFRRATLRYALENTRIEQWLADVARAAATDVPTAIELVRCQRLVKGYGDTHERGLRNYAAVHAAWQRGASAARLATLRDAALADEHGHALERELARSVP